MDSERTSCKNCGEFGYGNQSGFCSDHCIAAYQAKNQSSDDFTGLAAEVVSLREDVDFLKVSVAQLIELMKQSQDNFKRLMEQFKIVSGVDSDKA